MMIAAKTVARNRPMRVLHVVRQFIPTRGGLEAYVMTLCAQQQAQGLAPSVLTLNRMFHEREVALPRAETLEGVRVTRIPFVGGRRLFLPWFAPRRMADFAIVHVHGIDPLCDAVCLAKPVFRRPIVLTTHGGFFHTPDYALAKRIWFNSISRMTLARADAAIACSSNDQAMLRRIGIAAQVIRNAVSPLPPRDPTGFDMLYLGRLAANKRVDRLLSFVACLRDRGEALRLHIVGEDHDSMRDALGQQSAALGLDHLVTIHGYCAPEQLAHIIRDCRFFVSASRYEGFGMSLVEAMTAGLLPFVQDNAAFRELLAETDVGCLADFDQPDRCAEQFLDWCARLNATGADGAASGRARAFGARFSWQALADDVLAVYQRVLSSRGDTGWLDPLAEETGVSR